MFLGVLRPFSRTHLWCESLIAQSTDAGVERTVLQAKTVDNVLFHSGQILAVAQRPLFRRDCRGDPEVCKGGGVSLSYSTSCVTSLVAPDVSFKGRHRDRPPTRTCTNSPLTTHSSLTLRLEGGAQ